MPIPPSSERPDLYDDYDGRERTYLSPAYLIATTPDHIKQALEKKLGKPFAEIAQDMSDELKREEE
jgi:hypothetical protein